MVQWLGFWAFTALAWVQSLIRELRLRGATKKKKMKRWRFDSSQRSQEVASPRLVWQLHHITRLLRFLLYLSTAATLIWFHPLSLLKISRWPIEHQPKCPHSKQEAGGRGGIREKKRCSSRINQLPTFPEAPPDPFHVYVIGHLWLQRRLGNIYVAFRKKTSVLSLFSFNIYLFIWLHLVLVAAGGLLSCGMRTLSCGMRVGS